MQSEPQKRLQPAVGIIVCEIDEPSSVRRDAGAKASACLPSEHALREGRLHCREEDLVRRAVVDVRQHLIDGRESERSGTGEVVPDAVAPGVRMDSAAAAEPDMRLRVVVQHPDAVQPQRPAARQRATVLRRRDDIGMQAREGEDSLAHTNDSTCGDLRAQHPPAQTVAGQQRAADDTPVMGEDERGRVHASIVACVRHPWHVSGPSVEKSGPRASVRREPRRGYRRVEPISPYQCEISRQRGGGTGAAGQWPRQGGGHTAGGRSPTSQAVRVGVTGMRTAKVVLPGALSTVM